MSGARVAKNSMWLLGAEGSRRLVGFLIQALIARTLLVDDFGRYGLANSLAAIFSVLAGFGMSPLLVREVAAVRAEPEASGRLFKTTLGMRMILGVFATLAMYVFARAMGYSGATRQVVMLSALFVWGDAVAHTGEAMFDGVQRMDLSAWVTIIRSGAWLVGVAIAAALHLGVMGVVAAMVITAWFSAFFNTWIAHTRLPGVSFWPGVAGGWAMLRRAVPFVMIGFVWIVAFRVDMVILERLTDDRSAGLYRSGYSFFELLLTLPVLATRALFPALSAARAESHEQWNSLLGSSLRIFWIIALPVSIGSMIVGPRLVELVYGAKYAHGARVLALLGSFLWLWFGTMTFGWALTAANRLSDVLRANVYAMLVNLAVDFALIPKYSYWGAAAATIASEVFLLIYFLRVFLREYGSLPHEMFPVRAIPAALALAAVAWAMRTMNLALVIVAGGVVYFAVLFLFRALTDQERRVISRLLRRKQESNSPA
jgi:O-antigen/teichoic acid export membrane protein